MSKAVLQEFQKKQGATFRQDRPVHFGSSIQEISLLHKKPLLIDQSHFGAIVIRGEDRVSFLNRLVTIELKDIAPFVWKKGLWTNAKGRFEFRLFFYATENEIFLILEQEKIPHCLQKIEMYHFTEKITCTPVPLTLFLLQGQGSAQILQKVFGPPPLLGHFQKYEDVFVAFDPHYQCEEGFQILVPDIQLADIFRSLIEAGATPVGEEARTHFRILSLEPEVDFELTSEMIPLEVPSLESWISFNKGCFPGQEVLARMHNLGHPNKILASFSCPIKADLLESKTLFFEKKEVGTLTSVSPIVFPAVALGFFQWKLRETSSPFSLLEGQQEILVERIAQTLPSKF